MHKAIKAQLYFN